MKEWTKKEPDKPNEPIQYECKSDDIRVELSGPFMKNFWGVRMYDGEKLVYDVEFQLKADGSHESKGNDLYRAQKKALWDLEQFCVDTKNHWKDTASVVYGMRLG